MTESKGTHSELCGNHERVEGWRTQHACLVLHFATSLRSLLLRLYGNLKQRWNDHQLGRACRTTTLDPAVELLYYEQYAAIDIAVKRELQIKKWTRAKKEALIAGNKAKLKALARSRETA